MTAGRLARAAAAEPTAAEEEEEEGEDMVEGEAASIGRGEERGCAKTIL